MVHCVNLLLGIPADIASAILTLWLPVKCLPRVDSAFCNERSRAKLNSLYCSSGFIVHGVELDNLFKNVNYYKMRTIQNWKWARRIKFAHEHVVGDRAAHIPNLGTHMKSIQVCSFRNKKNEENSLQCIARLCPRLQIFQVSRSVLDSQLVELFRSCRNLQQIRLETTAVTFAFKPHQLDSVSLPHLHTISLVGCTLSSACVVAMVKMRANLLHLSLTESYDFCDRPKTTQPAGHQDMMQIAEYVPNLLTLCLHSQFLLDATLTSFIAACPRIRNLNISQCPKLSSASIHSVGQHLSSLHTLTLDGYEINSDAIDFLAERCQHTLCTLDYRNVSGYTTCGVNTIFRLCYLLRTLTLQIADVYHNDQFTYEIDVNWTLLCNISHLRLVPAECDYKDPNVTTLYTNIANNCLSLQYLRIEFTSVKISQLTVIVENCAHLHSLAFRMRDFYDPAVIQNWNNIRPSLLLVDICDQSDDAIYSYST